MGKSKIYVVAKGRVPGVYRAWTGKGQAQEQVSGFPGAEYKSFGTYAEAREWVEDLGVSNEKVLTPLSAGKDAPGAARTVRGKKGSSGGSAQAVDVMDYEKDLAAGKAVIFTDGACSGNPGPGGYACVILEGEKREERSGGFRGTTNNRMEILACIEGLEAVEEGSDVVLYSDSKYVVDALVKGWARRWRAKRWMRTQTEAAKNPDLWARLLDLYESRNVECRWLKGHAGSELNERCDELAVAQSQRSDLEPDEGYKRTAEQGSLF